MAKNKVIAGDFTGQGVFVSWDTVMIGELSNRNSWHKVDKSTVSSYEIVDENYKKSAASAVGRAAVGAFLLGPVGLLAGISAKNKGTHILAIHFKDGKNSLIEVDDKINKVIVTALF